MPDGCVQGGMSGQGHERYRVVGVHRIQDGGDAQDGGAV